LAVQIKKENIMTKNVGSVDKIIRYLIAAVIIVLYFFTSLIPGTLGIVLLIFAGVLVVTSLIGFCGLYTIFGIKTCPAKKR
jgi:hypothetical protein